MMKVDIWWRGVDEEEKYGPLTKWKIHLMWHQTAPPAVDSASHLGQFVS